MSLVSDKGRILYPRLIDERGVIMRRM